MGRMDFNFCCTQSRGQTHIKNSTTTCLPSKNVPVILNNSQTSLEVLSTKKVCIVCVKSVVGEVCGLFSVTKILILERRAAVEFFKSNFSIL